MTDLHGSAGQGGWYRFLKLLRHFKCWSGLTCTVYLPTATKPLLVPFQSCSGRIHSIVQGFIKKKHGSGSCVRTSLKMLKKKKIGVFKILSESDYQRKWQEMYLNKKYDNGLRFWQSKNISLTLMLAKLNDIPVPRSARTATMVGTLVQCNETVPLTLSHTHSDYLGSGRVKFW